MLEADEGDDEESDTDEEDDEEAVEATLRDDIMDLDKTDDPSTTFEPGVGSTSRKRARRTESGLGDWDFEAEDGTTKQMLSYDIYLKGNVSKAASFFKTDDNKQQRFRMFPHIERKRRFDSFGEVLDVGMWLRKGRAFEEEAEDEESREAKRRKEEETKVNFRISLYNAFSQFLAATTRARGTAL
jgi:cleavage and polyadenylation specificity factor subunit 2